MVKAQCQLDKLLAHAVSEVDVCMQRVELTAGEQRQNGLHGHFFGFGKLACKQRAELHISAEQLHQIKLNADRQMVESLRAVGGTA